MARLTTLATVAALSLLVLLFHYHERLAIATSLVATFFKFPHSHMTVISLPSETDSTTFESEDDLIVPSIFHQVKLGGLAMRPAWVEARSSCQELHPTWTFKLWEDEEANEFVKLHYPDLYPIYRGYPLEIQRSNVLRYLLLDQFGGVYLDLDLNCHRQLDFLRNESFLSPPANPTGVNNAFLVSSKGNPFWHHLIENLPSYNLNWYTPYLTNMFSTGCHFFSTMHHTFPNQASLKILDSTHKLNGHVTTPLFEHLGASSWHKGDAKLILQLGQVVETFKRQQSGLAISFLFFASVVTFASLFLIWKRQSSKERRIALDLESSKLACD